MGPKSFINLFIRKLSSCELKNEREVMQKNQTHGNEAVSEAISFDVEPAALADTS